MDKQSISLDSIFHKGIPNAAQYLYNPCGRVSRPGFHDYEGTDAIQHFPSDNNTCDILIEYAGGIKHINDYIHRLSIDSFNLSETEDGMHSSFEAVYRNWSTPSAMVLGLLMLLQQGTEDCWQTMIDTETGANKLKRYVFAS